MSIRGIFICLIACFFANSCTVNPVTGRKQFTIMSEAQEKAIGQSSDPQIIASFGLYEDPEIDAKVKEIGDEIVKICHRPDVGYNYRVLNSPVINAFAVPGGYVYLTRGILAHFNSEAELAGVFGHEIGHITARHSARQQTTQLLTQLGLITGSIVSPEFRSMADAWSQGAGLLLLSFSREHESESDELGVEYSMKIGYDAHQMANFFKTLDNMQEQAGAELPEFMSTHPDPGNRYVRVHELASMWEEQLGWTEPGISNRKEYLNMINGLVYGSDPRNGYIEDNMLYIPVVDLQMKSPPDWQHQLSNSQVLYLSPDEDAMVMFGQDPTQNVETGFQTFVENAQLQLTEQAENDMHGWDGIKFLGWIDQPEGQQDLAVGGVYFQTPSGVFYYIGISHLNVWDKYKSLIKDLYQSLNTIQSAAKKNVEPERIKIVEIENDAKFENILLQVGIEKERFNEMVLLNNMELDQIVPAGEWVKLFE